MRVCVHANQGEARWSNRGCFQLSILVRCQCAHRVSYFLVSTRPSRSHGCIPRAIRDQSPIGLVMTTTGGAPSDLSACYSLAQRRLGQPFQETALSPQFVKYPCTIREN